MLTVTKRDGTRVPFDLTKIEDVVERAFNAEHQEINKDILELLALRVTADFNKKIKDDSVSVEDIQDSVEIVLVQAGYIEIARSYMDYRHRHAALRQVKTTSLDFKNVVDSYLKVADWRVKENSTVTYSVGGLILSNSGAVTANYWLSEIYDKEIADAHRNADMHAHRLLRWLELKAAHPAGLRRRPWQDHLRSGETPYDPLQPDGQLLRHHAERVGWRSGLLFLRYLPRPIRQSR